MFEKRCIAVLVCVGLLAIGCSKKEEITYQGKPMRAWIEMLEDQNPAVRYSAIRAVGEMGPEAREAIPLLVETIRQVRNHDKKMLVACNSALLGMGKELVPYMISLLKDDEWEMRRGAAWLLGKVGPDAADAVPALNVALHDTNPAVRMKAADALRKITGQQPHSPKPVSSQSLPGKGQAPKKE